jgi:hypothetical protein
MIEVEELWGGEENTFGFGCSRPSSNVHFQTESANLMVYEFHPLLQVSPCAKRECVIVNA